MKNFCFRLLTLINIFTFLLFCGCVSNKSEDAHRNAEERVDHIEVIYFHGNMRCLTCRAIEKYAKETVDSVFKEEIKAGKVSFYSVDVAEDEEMADRYQTTGSSLYVTTVIDRKESRVDLTSFAFKTVRKHRKEFQDSIVTLIQKSLNEIDK